MDITIETVEEKLKTIYKEDQFDMTVDGVTVYNKAHKIERHFELPVEEELLLNQIKNFIQTHYTQGKYIYFNGYFEGLIDLNNFHQYFYDNGFDLSAPEGTNKEDIYYEIGGLSADFATMLESDIISDYFQPEHHHSIKIYNLKWNEKEKDKQKRIDEYIDACYYLGDIAFFDLNRKTGVSIAWQDLSADDVFEPDFEEVNFETINNTELAHGKYDRDLLKYFNRASQMTVSEFKYIAYFQVLECIFDEVYLYETVQDAKSIIDASWFRTSEFDHINKLIKVIDRYNKEQNDKNKTKLVLEKYFKMNLHDEAYLIANSDVKEFLEDINLIKSDAEFKDLQKLAGIIYDIRCEYTHSNRAFPKKRENVISNNELETHISIIKAIAETVIVNYKKQ